tara:strand:- start:1626 stop:2324 length:699 start_codon:yes stop_codon:yes gene_type:complete
MFDPFLEELHRSIREHGGLLLDLPEEFQEYSAPQNRAKIGSWLWDVPGFRRWRVTRLDAGENLQVLNSVAYPTYDKDQPIMGIDLLWFAKRNKLVAVLDFQPLIQDQMYFDKYFAQLRLIQERFPKFHHKGKMFSYDPNQYFSPWMLFCKGSRNEAIEFLPLVFTEFLNSYWIIQKNLNINSFQLTTNQVKNMQINYDKYGSEKDPAHGLFSTFFGKEWSDRFLKEFLFPLS